LAVGYISAASISSSAATSGLLPLDGRFMIACASLVAAANTKFSGLLLVNFIFIVAFCFIAISVIRNNIRVSTYVFLTLVTALAAANIKPTFNLLWYGSPFFPQPLELFGIVIFPGSEPVFAQPTGYTDVRPLNFLLSVTELDWFIRGVAAHYNIDMHTGDAP